MDNIFQYTDFRKYMEERLEEPPYGRGARGRMASFIGCQPSFITQVLKGRNELSLEHAHQVNLFFEHTGDESNYFINMVLLARSGSTGLGEYLENQLREIREKALSIDNVSPQAALSDEDTLTYYNDWRYPMIHMALTIPGFRTVESLVDRLHISEREVLEKLQFLTRSKLCKKVSDRYYEPGEVRIHLKKSAAFSKTAAIMMRLHNLERMDMLKKSDMNFSANITMSREKFELLKSRFRDLIKEINETLVDDEPESLYSLTIDLMEH